MNFRYTCFRQNSAHLLIISKTLFQNIFPNNNLKAPLLGKTLQIPVCLVRHKKTHLSLSWSAPMARFIRDNSSRYGLRKVRDNIHVPNNWYHKKPAWFYQRRKYRFSQLHKYAKVYAHSSDKPPMCEIPGLPHRCSRNSISRIKILISNHYSLRLHWQATIKSHS